MGRFIDLKGERFGRLTVIERSTRTDVSKNTYWLCKCVCGNEIVTAGYRLKQGHTKSCGCLQNETRRKNGAISGAKTKHGDCNERLYGIYQAMIQRCTNPKNARYKNYGGRNIDVCESWKKSYINFKKWALNNGYEAHLSIDRRNNDLGYNENNCRWITNREQQNNRTNNHIMVYRGEAKTIAEWSEVLGISQKTLHKRTVLGWSDDKALSTPIDTRYRRLKR